MHDNRVEDALRSVLRREGDDLTLNITAQELERRLALRRRERTGRRLSLVAAGIAVIAIGGVVAAGNGWLGSSAAVGGPPGPTVFGNASPSESVEPSPPEASSSSPSASQPDDGALPCNPLDPGQSSGPPFLVAAAAPGDAIGHGGATIASEWNGQETGTPGTWEGLLEEPDPIIVGRTADRIEAVSDGCFANVSAEALLTVYTEVPNPTPIPLRIIEGGTNSRVVDIEPPGVGGWTVRIRASFVTTDGSTAWSESLFAVMVPFDAPRLTMRSAGSETGPSNGGKCPSYRLASGASASDSCGMPYEPLTGMDPLVIGSGSSVELALSGEWLIDQMRVTAVDADVVAAGSFAPEYSVAFVDKAARRQTVAVKLDPGSWIIRVALNGSRAGDTFGSVYDLPLTVAR